MFIMAGKFNWEKFSKVDLDDSFFDSLKVDYPEFVEWFTKKKREGKNALVYIDDKGIGAFLYLKRENIEGDSSKLVVNGIEMPNIPRLKIGTLRLAERIRKQRLGEGALGVALWYWRDTKYDEIYVTVFDKHKELIALFERFGFSNIGKNERGECVYIKSRRNIDYKNSYKSFPFISNDFGLAGVLPIEDVYHDKLFPYSELAGNNQEIIEVTAGNGITKVFIAAPFTEIVYKIGMPVFIYRKHTGNGQKLYKSAITSYCTISNIVVIKENRSYNMSLEEFIHQAGNKSVYTETELTDLYYKKSNLISIELVYNGYFGKGQNVIYKNLKEKGMFENHPYSILYSREEFINVLEMGNADVQNIIID